MAEPGQAKKRNETCSTKHDFSSAKWLDATSIWLHGIKKRPGTLFPAVCDQAHALAGIKAKPLDVKRLRFTMDYAEVRIRDSRVTEREYGMQERSNRVLSVGFKTWLQLVCCALA